MAATRDGLGPFYRDVIAGDLLEPYGAASAAYRLELLARTLPFPVGGARLVPSNNDVWRLEAGYLRVARGPGPSGPGGRAARPLRRPAADPDPLRRAGAELVLLPSSSALELTPVAKQLPFTDHGVLAAAAARLADLGDQPARR